MKRIILTFAVVVITTISIVGQEPRRSPEERTEKIIAKMKSELVLSDDQVNKLQPVILKREQEREELRSKMRDAHDQHRQMAKQAEDDFKNILTPEQLEKLKQLRNEMTEKRVQRQSDVHREMNNKE
jgi:hypothetical protein